MMVGPNFVFIAVPRTATNTMQRVFLPQYGGLLVLPNHRRDIPKGHEHKFTFAIVRNPYDRWLSIYYHFRENRIKAALYSTPAEFVKLCQGWEHGLTQYDFLKPLRVDMVLRYEKLDTDIRKLPFVSPTATFTHRVLNASSRPDYRSDLTPEFISVVNEYSFKTFLKYDYQFLRAR